MSPLKFENTTVYVCVMGVKDYCCHIRCGEWKERTQMMNYHSRLTSATIESTCKAAQVSSYQVKQVKKKKERHLDITAVRLGELSRP